MTLPSIRTNTIDSNYGWNERAGRYVNLETKRFVKALEVRDALESAMGAAREQMHTITQQLIDKQISLAAWQTGMMEQIKLAHTAAAAAGTGGWAQMSAGDWGSAGGRVRKQYTFLKNFASQVASGKQPLDGRALVRADMYGEAARSTFEAMRRRYEMNNNGMDEERRLLGQADHCEDCLDAAALGWQPIGTLPEIGDSVCTTKCHCTFDYRRADSASEEGEA